MNMLIIYEHSFRNFAYYLFNLNIHKRVYSDKFYGLDRSACISRCIIKHKIFEMERSVTTDVSVM